MGFLRILLACAVVIAHSHSIYGFMGIGGAAVQAFFIVSGFYMTLILDKKYVGAGALKLFYSNRFLRLFPLYWFFLLLYVAVANFPSLGWTYLNNMSGAARNAVTLATEPTLPGFLAAIPNLFLVGADVLRLFLVNLQTMGLVPWQTGMAENAVFKGAYAWLVIPPIWSLSVELVFYAVAPFVVRLGPTRLLMLLAATVAMQFVELRMWPDQGWLNLTVPYNAGYFILGVVAYRMTPWVASLSRSRLFALAAVPVALVLGWQLIPWASVGDPEVRRSVSWMVWLLFAMGIPALFELTKTKATDQKIGNLSYPVYLGHSLFTNAFTPLGDLAAFAAILASCGLAQVAIWLVDHPIELLRQRRFARSQAASLR
jgi:peptidoglycan/LPS O-acetylase OafA/YrhL